MTFLWYFSAVFLIIKLIMSPPSVVVGWFVSKFAIHPKLDSKDVTVTFNGQHLKEEDKIRYTNYFNEAYFLKTHNVFRGYEKIYLEPETDITPFVINVKRGKKEIIFYIYNSDNHVDVVKQYKKNVVPYSLNSDDLLNFSISTN